MLEIWKLFSVVVVAADSMCVCTQNSSARCAVFLMMKKLMFSGYESCTVSNQ